MLILGISDSRHDRSVCLFENGNIVAAIEEERLSRYKHALQLDLTDEIRSRNIRKCIRYCLEVRKIKEKDIDDVYISSLYKKLAVPGKAVPPPSCSACGQCFLSF